MLSAAKAFRALSFIYEFGASSVRRKWISLKYPEIEFRGRVRIGPGCTIMTGRGAVVRITDCVISQNVTLVASAGATLLVDADFLANGVTVVARDYVSLGRGCQLAEGVTVRDQDHSRDVDGELVGFKSAPVYLGPRTWLGAKSTVLMGVKIGSGVTVGANAVVVHDLPSGSVAVGVPARVVR